jgi:hypothetical protein
MMYVDRIVFSQKVEHSFYSPLFLLLDKNRPEIIELEKIRAEDILCVLAPNELIPF